jgi:hypothetical protein
MRMGWQKVVAASVLSALGALSACSVEVIQGPPAGGSGGAGGATADAAPDRAADGPAGDAPGSDVVGTDATADVLDTDGGGDAPETDVATTPDVSSDAAEASLDGDTADTATTDGVIPDVPSDASGQCFAENQSDAGSTNDCTTLPYYGERCRDDAGLDAPPAGETLCTSLDVDLKVSAFQDLVACLKALPGGDGGLEACGSAHEQGSADCSRSLFNRSMCSVPDSAVDGGVYGCAQIAASCGPDSGDGGIPVALCQAWLGPFHATARQDMIDCYLDPAPTGATSCRDKFENYCVFN